MINSNHTPSLRPIQMSDFETVIKWSQNEAFCEANDWELNRTPDELYSWWEKCVENKNSDFIRIGIVLDNTLIGYGDLACINGSQAEIGIAIGDSALWGQGFGRVATNQLIEYGKTIGITTFLAETHETNIRAIKMLERIGFKEISRHGVEMYKGIKTTLIQFKLNI